MTKGKAITLGGLGIGSTVAATALPMYFLEIQPREEALAKKEQEIKLYLGKAKETNNQTTKKLMLALAREETLRGKITDLEEQLSVQKHNSSVLGSQVNELKGKLTVETNGRVKAERELAIARREDEHKDTQ